MLRRPVRFRVFPIPMRGNEDYTEVSHQDAGYVFPIPMRGNEGLHGEMTAVARYGFPIPMRGNECGSSPSP